MVKKVLIFFILLSAAFFFRIVAFPTQMIYLVQFGVTAMMLVVIVVMEVYGKRETIAHNFRSPIFLIFTGVFLSMVIAQSYHNQSYLLTFWAQRFMYYYLFYFFLHILRPEVKDLEKVVLTLGIIYAISYLFQYAIYPTAIFDVRQDVDRGTIRIFIPGSSFMTLSLFMCLHKFYTQNKLKYIFLVLLFFSILILIGTRFSLAVITFTSIMSLIFSKVVRSRYLIFVLFLISAIPVYFMFQDIFTGLIEVSEEQSEDIENNIRIRASTFFLTDFFPNTLAYFFGNGQDHMGSGYGMRVHTYKVVRGFYQSDIGIIGDFSKFGLFFLIGALWLLIKALRSPVKQEYTYIKYSLFTTLLALPVAGSFTNPFSIASLCIIMYIIDCSLHDLKQDKTGEELNN
ncbi:MAG: hypothetical protein ACOCWM_00160 [Cyclobacteriaceae bacterium]